MNTPLRQNNGYHEFGLLRGIAALLLSCQTISVAQIPASPLRQAHAHNDYLHERPLLDAVQNRFASVEADIFLVDGELLVAHTFWELDRNRTLQKLYLDPLKELTQANGGTVFKDAAAEFTLLIDIKNKEILLKLKIEKLLATGKFLEGVVLYFQDGSGENSQDELVFRMTRDAQGR